MDDLERSEIVARYGKYFKARGLFGKPGITIGVQCFTLHHDKIEGEDAQEDNIYREWLREMVCVALHNLVRAETSDAIEALRARVVAARRDAFEEAAKVCKDKAKYWDDEASKSNRTVRLYCEAKAVASLEQDAAIRALAEKG